MNQRDSIILSLYKIRIEMRVNGNVITLWFTFTVILSNPGPRVGVKDPHVYPALPHYVVPAAGNLVQVPMRADEKRLEITLSE